MTCSHAESLRMRRLIVRLLQNLWMAALRHVD
jgi:hypothetical protein